ncbi:MAG: DNA polymerase I [Elusimicrobiota bacterium]
MTEKKIILIDGNSYLHRAYHALPKLTDAKGNIVNVVFGFLKMLKKVLNQENPTHILVAFDHKAPTFRHEDFEDYKAHREETDKELIQQIPKVLDMLETLKIKFLHHKGYEADDIIATFANKAKQTGMPVTIVTGDKDILQLVKDNITVTNGMKDRVYDSQEVKEKLGVEPEQVIDYISLVGDKSDNLPGVRGIGPVTAKKLLNKYKNLDEIYENIEGLSSRVKKKLKKNKENAYVTRSLAVLVKDLDLPISIKDCKWIGPDNEKLIKKLKGLNFKSLISDWIDSEQLRGEINTEVVKDASRFKEAIKENSDKNIIGLEIVFAGQGSSNLKDLVGLGFSFDGKNCFYIPISHSYLGLEKQIEWQEIKEIFAHKLFNKKKNYIAYNLKDIYKFFKTQNLDLEELGFDSITADYVINTEVKKTDLKSLCSKYLEWVPEEIEEKPGHQEIEKLGHKVSTRLAAVFELNRKMTEKIKEQSAERLFREIELKILKILAEMELTGIKIDVQEMKRTEQEFKKDISEIEDEIFDIAGEKFNVNSSKQLSRILFSKLDLEPVRKTKTGYSTAEDVLDQLSDIHPLPEKVMEHRKLQKLVSTYVQPLPKMSDPNTNRLHTTFNITGTATGRLSSSEPNLQNIPVKDDIGCMIRKMFIPEKGNIFLSADYSQIDLRVLAHISQDENLIEAFNNKEDIHTKTASKIFEVSEDEVTPKMRKKAKAINFGIVYGMSSFGLSKRVDLSKEESKEFIKKYFQQYPGVENYMKEIVSTAREQRYVKTLLNRRRPLPEIRSSNFMRRKLFERMAINTPIQGSSADIIKIAMVRLNEDFKFNAGPNKLLLQIHDELLFELPEENIEDFKQKVKKKMENAIELSVPLVVDFKKGKNWRDLDKC